jgi:hypothetical protein
MTIFKVDDETFSIIVLALHECGYDLDGLDVEIFNEVEEVSCDKCDKHDKIVKKDKKKKSCVD